MTSLNATQEIYSCAEIGTVAKLVALEGMRTYGFVEREVYHAIRGLLMSTQTVLIRE